MVGANLCDILWDLVRNPSFKYVEQNAKFGSGGKKHGLKVNTGSSAGDMSGFHEKRNKSVRYHLFA